MHEKTQAHTQSEWTGKQNKVIERSKGRRKDSIINSYTGTVHRKWPTQTCESSNVENATNLHRKV